MNNACLEQQCAAVKTDNGRQPLGNQHSGTASTQQHNTSKLNDAANDQHNDAAAAATHNHVPASVVTAPADAAATSDQGNNACNRLHNNELVTTDTAVPSSDTLVTAKPTPCLPAKHLDNHSSLIEPANLSTHNDCASAADLPNKVCHYDRTRANAAHYIECTSTPSVCVEVKSTNKLDLDSGVLANERRACDQVTENPSPERPIAALPVPIIDKQSITSHKTAADVTMPTESGSATTTSQAAERDVEQGVLSTLTSNSDRNSASPLDQTASAGLCNKTEAIATTDNSQTNDNLSKPDAATNSGSSSRGKQTDSLGAATKQQQHVSAFSNMTVGHQLLPGGHTVDSKKTAQQPVVHSKPVGTVQPVVVPPLPPLPQPPLPQPPRHLSPEAGHSLSALACAASAELNKLERAEKFAQMMCAKASRACQFCGEVLRSNVELHQHER